MSLYHSSVGVHFIAICDVTGQNQELVANCHLPQIKCYLICRKKNFLGQFDILVPPLLLMSITLD